MVSETSAASASSSSPIKTLVILVQENRSFDHMVGWMKSLNPEINGVTGTESNPISTSDPNSNRVYFTDNSAYVDPDPGHSFQAIYEQVFGEPWSQTSASNDLKTPTMEGFAQNAESTQKGMSETVMSGFKPEAVPVFKELVSEFAVCDRWFASLPSATQPNRLYLHSATSHGATSNDTKQLLEGYPQKTIFESLEEGGFSFGIYFQSVPATMFYRESPAGSKHFFCEIEFKESQSSFALFGINSLPHIRLVGPNVKSLKDSEQLDQDISPGWPNRWLNSSNPKRSFSLVRSSDLRSFPNGKCWWLCSRY